MKNVKRVIIAVLLIVLVCTLFVACNDNIDDNDDNNTTRGNDYQLVDKKPFAEPDLNNKFDLMNDSEKTDFSTVEFEGKIIYVTLTNSESLNNLFYNYKVEDFGVDKFSQIEDFFTKDLDAMRKQIFNHIAFDIKDSNTRDPQIFTRTLSLTLINPGRENALALIEELSKKAYIREVVPDNKLGGHWFKTTDDTYRAPQ